MNQASGNNSRTQQPPKGEIEPLLGEPWNDGIAIIGMSARFPRSQNVREYWQNLIDGKVLIEDLRDADLRQNGVADAMLDDSSYVRRGNAIENADCFDRDFFGLSRREAEILDPQHRVFLECAWEALENAGRTGQRERVGIFAGAGINTYILQILGNSEMLRSVGDYQLMLASDKDFLATRAAYKLNLRGPAVTVQTACSTSLAAVHLACRSLLNHECSMALAGGVSISFPQAIGYTYVPGMILSPDGYCRPFDEKSQGTVPGRGAGIVVLKRLSEAIADRDSIVAVIRGSAWNNDGAGKVGYTAPSIQGQTEVIRAALASACIESGRVSYVETHGTATELGDAIEFAALSEVFEAETRKRPLFLGAVKANMGHADVAAGVAGLIKAALAVKSGLIPPTPTFTRSNPILEIERSCFAMSSSVVDWGGDIDRWAGVSSFGIGGTNVHVVLSSPPQIGREESEPQKPRIYPVSAKDAAALSAACEQLSVELSDTSLSPRDVATTLQLGRHHFNFRRAVVASSCAQAASTLQKRAEKSVSEIDLSRDVVFLFPGQGQQFPAMAAALYHQDLEFRRLIDSGCTLLEEKTGLDLRRFLIDGESDPSVSDQLRNTEIAQPALFCVEYALAHRLRSLGVEPTSLLGHSLGELSAAAVAGVFSFEDGLLLAAERGRLMANTPPGLMLAVMLPVERLNGYLDDGLWLAAMNGPKMSVASGHVSAVENLERRLNAEKVASVRLGSKNAFHTPLMADAAKSFGTAVAAVTRHAPTVPWLSNVTGKWISSAEAQSPQYWANQIISPVQFTSCLSELTDRPRLLMEVGPGEALLGIARQKLPTSLRAPCLGTEDHHSPDAHIFFEALATAWQSGLSIQWEQLDPECKGRRVALPTYPFQRQRYWIDRPSEMSAAVQPTPSASTPTAPSLPPSNPDKIASWFYVPCWQGTPPASFVLPAQSRGSECWLTLAGEDQLSDELISALRVRGDTVVAVKAGAEFEWREGNAIVNPSSAADSQLLWKQINASRVEPSGLLCLPGFTTDGLAYEAILHLLQAAGSSRRQLKRFEFVMTALESVSGEPVGESYGGDLAGLAHVIPLEFEGSECRTIDIEPHDATSSSSVAQLLEELSTCGNGLAVALRRGTRWQKTWARAPLKSGDHSPFRDTGVYIITGGTGGIGYVMAKHLLSQHDARVVIVGRSTLPDQNEWESWVAEHGEGDRTSRQIRRIEDLERAGGEILYLAADVADYQAMRSVFEQTEQRFGPPNGVIHAAGIAGGSRITLQSAAEAQTIRSPKIAGSRVLAELLQGRNIDFLLFCSSISSYFPGPTESAYATANSFQNNFAGYCRTTLQIPAVAIAFDAWREVGMVADAVVPEVLQPYINEMKRRAMDNLEGIEVIRRVLLQWRGTQILVSTNNIAAPPSLTANQTLRSESAHENSQDVESKELLVIIEIWKDLLGVDTIIPSDNFFNLGGHSLMGTMMIARIREQLGIALSMRDVFEAQTPARLAELVRATGQSTTDSQPPAPLARQEEWEVFEI